MPRRRRREERGLPRTQEPQAYCLRRRPHLAPGQTNKARDPPPPTEAETSKGGSAVLLKAKARSARHGAKKKEMTRRRSLGLAFFPFPQTDPRRRLRRHTRKSARSPARRDFLGEACPATARGRPRTASQTAPPDSPCRSFQKTQRPSCERRRMRREQRERLVLAATAQRAQHTKRRGRKEEWPQPKHGRRRPRSAPHSEGLEVREAEH